MKSLVDQLALYHAYHRNKWNVFTHFIGIPSIIFGLFIALGWLRYSIGEFEISFAMFFFLIAISYYFYLDFSFAIGMLFCVGIILYGSEYVALQGVEVGISLFLYTFLGGWVLQFIGHLFEGRQPAFFVNLTQLLIGPLYLWAKVVYFIGMRKKEKETILKLSENF